MSVSSKKLSDLGKPWDQAPAWLKRAAASHETAPQEEEGEAEPYGAAERYSEAEQYAAERYAAPLVPNIEPRPKPVDLDDELRRQYEIWCDENLPQPIGGSLPPMPSVQPLPPIEETKFDLRRGARVVLMIGGAALAAFYVVGVLPNLNRDEARSESAPLGETTVLKVASADPAVKAARLEVPPMPVTPKQPAAPKWPDPVRPASVARDNTSPSSPSTPADPAPAPVAVSAPPAPEPQTVAAEPAPKAARAMSQDEIDLLLKRGEEFVTEGDLASARLLLERAARAQNARAAFALASTYDPSVLEKMKVVGTRGDLELAIMWYERAKQYGSRDAGQRLTALAGRM